ncbi:MAG TPA: universal stress protein [Wenzhouxiangellaceae bacterium]|nr:universal stress protein [Wenzhouxiangellaceae bacterium]
MSPALRRILVALDTSAGSRAALRRAAELAQRIDAEMSGLFVQDENLVQLAALPFARELSASGGAGRSLSPDAMQRELDRQALLLQEELQAIAAVLDLRWSFQTRRGRVVREIADAFAGHNLLVIGRAGMQPGYRRLGSTARNLLSQSGFPVMLIGPARVSVERVLAVVDHSSTANRVMRRALELTSPDHPLQVLACVARREELAPLELMLRELAAPSAIEIHALVDGNGQALMECVLRIAPTMLVVGQSERLDPVALEALAWRIDGAILRIPDPGSAPAGRKQRR